VNYSSSATRSVPRQSAGSFKALRVPPAPQRQTDSTWRQFLPTPASTMLACEVFPADSAVTLQRRYCLFVMEPGPRSVHIIGVTANPDGPWPAQQIRNLPMDLGDRAAQFQFLIRDRAGQFTASCDALLADASIAAAKIPSRSPRANASAKRLVLTVRTEVTDRMPIFDQRHLRAVVAQYARHHNRRRPHRAPQFQPPQPDHPIPTITPEWNRSRSLLA
jgi:putative transposase